jgi:hypothetical protein
VTRDPLAVAARRLLKALDGREQDARLFRSDFVGLQAWNLWARRITAARAAVERALAQRRKGK